VALVFVKSALIALIIKLTINRFVKPDTRSIKAQAKSIHGGSESGSGGRIDLVDNDKSFFDHLLKYRGNITYISLTVKYLDQ
jgi:hypothetical protein